jgi:DNA-directed RNA polymerase subunit M/transcription elongation factor TFIIS
MSKFCAECGFVLSAAASFCGGCGAGVNKNCPTCGQSLPTDKNGKDKKSTVSTRPSTSNFNTSAKPSKMPVYGGKYNQEYDCPNCGAKDQKYELCKQCGEDNE